MAEKTVGQAPAPPAPINAGNPAEAVEAALIQESAATRENVATTEDAALWSLLNIC